MSAARSDDRSQRGRTVNFSRTCPALPAQGPTSASSLRCRCRRKSERYFCAAALAAAAAAAQRTVAPTLRRRRAGRTGSHRARQRFAASTSPRLLEARARVCDAPVRAAAHLGRPQSLAAETEIDIAAAASGRAASPPRRPWAASLSSAGPGIGRRRAACAPRRKRLAGGTSSRFRRERYSTRVNSVQFVCPPERATRQRNGGRGLQHGDSRFPSRYAPR